jgi:hypothetical protein
VNNLKILHNYKEGDLLLTTVSRKNRDRYSCCSIIFKNHVLHTIHTSCGPQTVEIELMEYLEHENKPIKQFRYKTEPLILRYNNKEKVITKSATDLMIKYITVPLYRRGISQYFYREAFKKDNSVNINSRIIDYLKLSTLAEIDTCGKFISVI